MLTVKDFLWLFAILLLWGLFVALVVIVSSVSLSYAVNSAVGAKEERVVFATNDGWQTSVVADNGALRQCTATKYVSNSVVAEIEYDKEAPVLRVTGARFLDSNDPRAVLAVDSNRPVPVLAQGDGRTGWSTRFFVPPSKDLWNQIRGGTTLVLVVDDRKIELSLKGSNTTLDNLEKCVKNGQEFLDRRLIQHAQPAPTLGG